MSSEPGVIFPLLFWFIYKWIEVWSKSQYCAALKIKAGLSFLHTRTHILPPRWMSRHTYWVLGFDKPKNFVFCLILPSSLPRWRWPPRPPPCDSWPHTELCSAALVCTGWRMWGPRGVIISQNYGRRWVGTFPVSFLSSNSTLLKSILTGW